MSSLVRKVRTDSQKGVLAKLPEAAPDGENGIWCPVSNRHG
jgi:hypothetical protein